MDPGQVGLNARRTRDICNALPKKTIAMTGKTRDPAQANLTVRRGSIDIVDLSALDL
jgi:hypothetical protein